MKRAYGFYKPPAPTDLKPAKAPIPKEKFKDIPYTTTDQTPMRKCKL